MTCFDTGAHGGGGINGVVKGFQVKIFDVL